ncbi:MAG: ferrous iron transport protein A [Pedobacter sp.]|nr:MAG: ferrous iron transport protein A [Pedobacter sp.]
MLKTYLLDPHGDPIPKANGEITLIPKILLADLGAGQSGKVTAVKDTSTSFLKYLEKLKVTIGTKITIVEIIEFDGSMNITIEDQPVRNVSTKFAESLFVL